MSAISRQSPLKRYGPRGGGEPPTPGDRKSTRLNSTDGLPISGDAEHVDAVVAELGQHVRDQPAEPAEAVRPAGRGRAADAGRVEPDRLDRRIEFGHERLEQLQAGPDAVD